MTGVAEAIARGVGIMDIALDSEAIDRLAAYVALLEKWNRTYNLTAVRRTPDMVPRHILDSLSIRSLVTGKRLLDVGTGAGLPGIPLAIALPELEVVMLDSSSKKLRFVDQAIAELGLANASTVHARLEEFCPPEPFDCVTSRALGSIDVLFHGVSNGVLSASGRIVAMKGAVPMAEIEALRDEAAEIRVQPLQVAGLEGERHAILVQPRPNEPQSD